jgi:hypothetical protein
VTRVLLVALGLGLAACPDRGRAPAPRPLGTLSPAAEAERQRRVQRELDRATAVRLTFDAASLAPADRAFLAALVRVAGAVDAVDRLAGHPDALRQGQVIAARGTARDRALYDRLRTPWCRHDRHPLCTAHPDAPPRPRGIALWPADLTAAELRAPGAAGRLGPFTAVRRRADGRLEAVPYAADPVLAPALRDLAATLAAAAGLAPTPSLEAFLAARARAVVTATTDPYAASDAAWVAADGPWEVTVGPHEVYRDPWHVKARFQLVVGRVDPARTAALRAWIDRFAALARPHEDVAGQLAVRAVRVLLVAGDAHLTEGAIAAYVLPNRPRCPALPRRKLVVLIDHARIFARDAHRRAARWLEGAPQTPRTEDAALLGLALHELAHHLAPAEDASALPDDRVALGELRADAVALDLVGRGLARRVISLAEARGAVLALIVDLLARLGGPPVGPYEQAAAVQLGWLLERGAVRFTPQTGRFAVDEDLLPSAAAALARHVGRPGPGSDLLRRYLERSPGRPAGYAGVLAGPTAALRRDRDAFREPALAVEHRVLGL